MCSWNSLSITFPFFLLTFIPWVVLLSPNYSRLPSLSHSILSSFGSLSLSFFFPPVTSITRITLFCLPVLPLSLFSVPFISQTVFLSFPFPYFPSLVSVVSRLSPHVLPSNRLPVFPFLCHPVLLTALSSSSTLSARLCTRSPFLMSRLHMPSPSAMLLFRPFSFISAAVLSFYLALGFPLPLLSSTLIFRAPRHLVLVMTRP